MGQTPLKPHQSNRYIQSIDVCSNFKLHPDTFEVNSSKDKRNDSETDVNQNRHKRHICLLSCLPYKTESLFRAIRNKNSATVEILSLLKVTKDKAVLEKEKKILVYLVRNSPEKTGTMFFVLFNHKL